MRHLIPLLFCTFLLLPVLGAPAWATETAEDARDGYVLSAAYPNPFNPSTSFELTVDRQQNVRVEVFNVLGQRVRLLFDGMMEEGESRAFLFEADDLPSGIYLYRVTGQEFVATRQITLLK